MMNETKSVRVTRVKTVGEHVVHVRWRSGIAWAVDLRAWVFGLKALRALRDEKAFALVAVGEGGHSLVWPGDLDIGADRLWELSLEQNGRADVAEFLRWRWRNGLSLNAGAQALGLSRRVVAYYASGTREVPRTVLLACKGWDVESQRRAA